MKWWVKLYVKLPNAQELLKVMQEQLKRYYKASIKPTGKRKDCLERRLAVEKGIYPYFSLYGLIYNKYNFGIRNGEIDSDGSSKSAYRHILARCHWPGGKPGLAFAKNPSETEIWEALYYAESEAYSNFKKVESSDRAILPRHMSTPEFIYCDEKVNEGALAEYKHLSKPYIIRFLKSAEKAIREAHPKVLGSSASMILHIGYSVFTDNWGARIIQELPRTYMVLEASAYAKDLEENKLEFIDSLGGTGGKKLLQRLRTPALRKARRLGQKVVEFANARGSYKNGGEEIILNSMDGVTLLLDSELAGGCVHELFKAGHMGELDRFLTDEQIAQPITGDSGVKELNVYDDPTAEWPPENPIKPGSWYIYDAEGTKAQRTHIVKSGKTAEAYTSRLIIGTAQKSLEDTFGESITPEIKNMIKEGRLTGNVRIEDVLIENSDNEMVPAEPFTRMSTLFIQPSNLKNRSLKNMKDQIRGKKNAFYCTGFVQGEVATDTGQGYVIPREVYFINKYGKEIPLRKGKHQIRIIGDALSFMRRIKMIGDASTVEQGEGHCGAESGFVPQTIISPAFLIEGAKIEAVHQGADKGYKAPLIGPPKRKRTKEL